MSLFYNISSKSINAFKCNGYQCGINHLDIYSIFYLPNQITPLIRLIFSKDDKGIFFF